MNNNEKDVKPIYIQDGMISDLQIERIEKLSNRPVCLVKTNPIECVYDPYGEQHAKKSEECSKKCKCGDKATSEWLTLPICEKCRNALINEAFDRTKPEYSNKPLECVKHHYIKPGKGEPYCLGCGKRPYEENLIDCNKIIEDASTRKNEESVSGLPLGSSSKCIISQSASTKPSPPSEPSEQRKEGCEHEWAKVFYPNTMKLLRYDCMKCDESKPAEQPKEKEVLNDSEPDGCRCAVRPSPLCPVHSKLPQKDVLSVEEVTSVVAQQYNAYNTESCSDHCRRIGKAIHQALVKEE